MKNGKILIVTATLGLLLVVACSSMFNENNNDISNFIFIESTTYEAENTIEEDSERMCKRLEMLKVQDELAIGPVYAKFMQIRKHKVELSSYIMSLRGDLIAEADGISSFKGDTLSLRLIKNPGDISSVSKIMIGDGKNGATTQLMNRFIQLEKAINVLPAYSSGRKAHVIDETVFQWQTGRNENWETMLFKGRSLIETLIVLDQLHLRLIVMENEALHSYFDKAQ
jgi:hypothetical protein